MRFLLSVVLWFSLAVGGANAFPVAGAEFVSDQLIVEVARRSLELEGEANEAKAKAKPTKPCNKDCRGKILQQRTLEVQHFFATVGGDDWLKGWLKKFGPPSIKEERVFATLIGNRDSELGYYYIRLAPVSTAFMTDIYCGGPRFADSVTQKAFCALGLRNAALAFNDHKALGRFMELSDWFVKNNHDGKWLWTIDVPSRGLKAPWVSCLSQSLGISVLLRRYQLGQDVRYLEAAKKALEVMRTTVRDGGCAFAMDRGIWFEEYPNLEKPSHVLNGHMWALFGIWDFYRVTGDPSARKLFDQGMSALIQELPKYDLGYWSVYSQDNRVDLVEGNYQTFIIEQLKVLEDLSGDERLRSYIQRWEKAMLNDQGFVELAAREFNKSLVGK